MSSDSSHGNVSNRIRFILDGRSNALVSPDGNKTYILLSDITPDKVLELDKTFREHDIKADFKMSTSFGVPVAVVPHQKVVFYEAVFNGIIPDQPFCIKPNNQRQAKEYVAKFTEALAMKRELSRRKHFTYYDREIGIPAEYTGDAPITPEITAAARVITQGEFKDLSGLRYAFKKKKPEVFEASLSSLDSAVRREAVKDIVIQIISSVTSQDAIYNAKTMTITVPHPPSERPSEDPFLKLSNWAMAVAKDPYKFACVDGTRDVKAIVEQAREEEREAQAAAENERQQAESWTNRMAQHKNVKGGTIVDSQRDNPIIPSHSSVH